MIKELLDKMVNIPSVAERFKANAVGLAQNFKAINNTALEKGFHFVKREITVFIEAYISRLDAKDLLQTFAMYSYPYWEEIANRDTNFFNEHAESVFDFSKAVDTDLKAIAGHPKNVILFKQLLTNPNAVTEDDQLLFWRYFEAMVRICWKALLEDEARGRVSSEDDYWIPTEYREKILSMENVETFIQMIEDRKRSI
jgi:hypothetical protein